MLPTVTLADVTALATTRLGGEGEVVLATLPQKDSVKVPQEADIRAALSGSGQRGSHPVERRNDNPCPGGEEPQPARDRVARELADIGVTIVKFANGVEHG